MPKAKNPATDNSPPPMQPIIIETPEVKVVKPRVRKKAVAELPPVEELALTPFPIKEKERKKPLDDDIIIKNSTSPRKRPTSLAPRQSRTVASRRPKNLAEFIGPDPIYPQRSFSDRLNRANPLSSLGSAAQHQVVGIALMIAGLILLLGMVSQEGFIAQVGIFARQILGVGAFIIPPLIVLTGGTFVWEGLSGRNYFNQTRVIGVVFMIVAFLSVIHLIAGNPLSMAMNGEGGGYFAFYINKILGGLITPFGVFLLWLGMFVIGLMLALTMSLQDMGSKIRNGFRWLKGSPPLVAGEPVESDDYYMDDDEYYEDDYAPPPPRRSGRNRQQLEDDDLLDDYLLNGSSNGKPRRPPTATLVPEPPQYTHSITLKEETQEVVAPIPPAKPLQTKPDPRDKDKVQRPFQQGQKREEPFVAGETSEPNAPRREWQVPPLSMLASFSDVEVNPQELRRKARLIENTLASFGVEAVVREVNTGPTVTQFALEPGLGIKVARITALANDLALALAAPTIRLEAPVPGQSRVGIEVPNNKVATVGLREIMETEDYNQRPGRLKFGLGRDVSGQPIVSDLAKMPHLLIAGSTGSGKSVCLNSIVAAYLLQYRPNELQFIMIDPKMVELSTYNGIPHLRFPVVTQIESDPEMERRNTDRVPTVMSVLKWSIREMEQRYKKLSLYGHRNIESYNKIAAMDDNDLEKLPYLVIIVDELADLMMVAPEEAESAICRLAQKARAVGIHLILATQRPSVDVVTGLIKANFPSRITFAVTSQIDSRVILDMAGAEKLLGRGDMLYLASDAPKPIRVQGVYVSDEEIDKMVKHWRLQNDFLNGDKKDFVQPSLWPQDLREIEAERDAVQTDELFEEALELIRETRTASTSLLQRRLRIGYNRAARLIEELEQAGVIGQADGSRPRTVLLDDDDMNEAHSLAAAVSAFEPELPPPAKVKQETPKPIAPASKTRPRSNLPPATTDFDPDPPL